MKRILLSTLLATILPVVACANTYTFETTGLTSLSHGTAYTWGLSPTANSAGKPLGNLEKQIQNGGRVKSATLTITGLYDWTVEPADVLYINLLNHLKPGISSFTYNTHASSYDTVFGTDVFDVADKPDALIKPVAPTKPTLTKPTAPAKPTLTLPIAPTEPTLTKPTAPAALPAFPKPTAAQTAAYKAALAAYNTALKAYNAAQTKYTSDLSAYNTKLTAYNAAQTKYAADLLAYNTKLTAYNAAQAKYAADNAVYAAALAVYNAALPDYNAKLMDYNWYAKTQAALGFDGVPVIASGDSLYDQNHSLLRADVPNGPGTWTDLDGPKTKTNLVITFSAENLQLLQALLANGSDPTNIGLGFGPDCHFYDKDIKLEITAVPEAGDTVALFGLGLLSLLGLRRFSGKKN